MALCGAERTSSEAAVSYLLKLPNHRICHAVLNGLLFIVSTV
jgi:hypothetical protein